MKECAPTAPASRPTSAAEVRPGRLAPTSGTCGRCVLTDRLTLLLDDGTDRVRPELVPLFDTICAMPRPRAGILWLSKPHVPPILHALAHGAVPLTHEGLAASPPGDQ